LLSSKNQESVAEAADVVYKGQQLGLSLLSKPSRQVPKVMFNQGQMKTLKAAANALGEANQALIKAEQIGDGSTRISVAHPELATAAAQVAQTVAETASDATQSAVAVIQGVTSQQPEEKSAAVATAKRTMEVAVDESRGARDLQKKARLAFESIPEATRHPDAKATLDAVNQAVMVAARA
jgi:hypothetical protein